MPTQTIDLSELKDVIHRRTEALEKFKEFLRALVELLIIAYEDRRPELSRDGIIINSEGWCFKYWQSKEWRLYQPRGDKRECLIDQRLDDGRTLQLFAAHVSHSNFVGGIINSINADTADFRNALAKALESCPEPTQIR